MKFIKDSFIVNDYVKLAIVDKRITPTMEKNLRARGIDLIKTIGCENSYDAIKFHPDISIFKLNDENIVVSPDVYDYYNDKLKKYNFNVIKGDLPIESKYPNNIQYNVCLFGKYAIHNFDYTDKNILNYIKENNLTMINVNQGYTKCSVCIVDENSIITSDEGIYKEVIKHNIDCLLISKGNIDLFNMNYGFIGGCSGLISHKELAFYGNIKLHPDYNMIYDFVKSKNKEIVSLSDEKLLDLGSLIPIMY